MNDQPEDPVPLREALDAVGAELGLPQPEAWSSLEARWGEIVGDDVAGHARATGVRDGTLVIVVDDGSWGTRLRYAEDAVVRAAAAVLGPGVVRALRVRVQRRE